MTEAGACIEVPEVAGFVPHDGVWARAEGSHHDSRAHAWIRRYTVCDRVNHIAGMPSETRSSSPPRNACTVCLTILSEALITAPGLLHVAVGPKRQARIENWAKTNGFGVGRAKSIIFAAGMRVLLPKDGPDAEMPDWATREHRIP